VAARWEKFFDCTKQVPQLKRRLSTPLPAFNFAPRAIAFSSLISRVPSDQLKEVPTHFLDIASDIAASNYCAAIYFMPAQEQMVCVKDSKS